jgi:hypothetical protein
MLRRKPDYKRSHKAWYMEIGRKQVWLGTIRAVVRFQAGETAGVRGLPVAVAELVTIPTHYPSRETVLQIQLFAVPMRRPLPRRALRPYAPFA